MTDNMFDMLQDTRLQDDGCPNYPDHGDWSWHWERKNFVVKYAIMNVSRAAMPGFDWNANE